MLKRPPLCLGILLLISTVGCYAPMKTRAIPACQLPESFRAPHRSFVAPLNISTLTQSSDDADVLRAGDLVEIRVPDLFGAGSVESMQARLDDNGTVYVPLAGPVEHRLD